MRAALLLSTLPLGCSFLLTRAPSDDWEESRPIDCRSSPLAAVADGAVAATGLIFSVAVAAYVIDGDGCNTGDSNSRDGGDCGIVIPAIVGGALGGAGYAFSAWRGGRNTAACDQAGGRHSRWLEGERARLSEEPVARPPPPPPDAGPPPPPDAGAPDAGIADAVVP